VKDEQLFAVDFQSSVFRVYNGDVQTQGVEADTGIRLGGGFDVTTGFAWMTGEVSRLDPILIAQGIRDGNRPTQLPRFSGSAALSHRMKLGSAFTGGPELMTLFSYNHVGARFGDVNNRTGLPPINLGKIRWSIWAPAAGCQRGSWPRRFRPRR
jgi:outer membrane receptor protein involved in Fe transport